MDYIKIKNFCSSKSNIKSKKAIHRKGENICNTDFWQKIYKPE